MVTGLTDKQTDRQPFNQFPDVIGPKCCAGYSGASQLSPVLTTLTTHRARINISVVSDPGAVSRVTSYPGVTMLTPLLLLPALVLASPPPAPILFIISSQPGQFHSEVADRSRRSLTEQWKVFVPPSLMSPPRVLLTGDMDPEVISSPCHGIIITQYFRSRITPGPSSP